MSYLLDTDILSYEVHGIPAARELIAGLARGGISTTTITYMELQQGLSRGPSPDVASRRFQNLIEEIPIISFGLREAEQAAQLFEELRRDGRRVRSRALDLLIAATAMAHDLTLVSNNEADYSDIPDLRFFPARMFH